MNVDKKRSIMLKTGLVAVLVLVYVLSESVQKNIKQVIFIMSNLDVGLVKGYILSFGIWAPVISFFLMIFQSIAAPLPAFLITFANAGLFGWVKGAILSWSSAMAGAALCFFIAKFYGRSAVEKLSSKFALEGIDNFFEKYGNYAILIARLLPFMSFDIVSYAAGLTSMSFWSFFWATGLGQLPATIIYSYIGGMLTGGMKKFVFGLLMMFSMSILVFLIKKVWDEKNTKKKNKGGENEIG
ncbi:TVP38/TMEM64 family protein [Proteocatella sphenisci]|uniref:TVP38/TMEM64 family protein n=1 Tax=Proteocatella sphenisci TaxID=181070 RepID=UPI0004AE44E0|nr:TVP38/TMEM64 family protein [Proteocatella sphenisci]